MKILFLHGLASSGAYKTANTLRILLRPCDVIAPDIPIEPQAALDLLQEICRQEAPDLVVGLSLGGFWAQQLRGFRKILINPDFHVSDLMRSHLGTNQYLSPRRDGALSFDITQEICEGYAALEQRQFEGITPEEIVRTRGMFADHDTIVNEWDTFEAHYPGRAVHYPGEHLPTFPEIKHFLLPLVGIDPGFRKKV